MNADEYDFHYNPRTDRTYVGAPFADIKRHMTLRRVMKVFDTEQGKLEQCRDYEEGIDYFVLHEHTESRTRVQLRAYLYADSNEVQRVLFSRFRDNDLQQYHQFELTGDDLRRVSLMLQVVRARPLDAPAEHLTDADWISGDDPAMIGNVRDHLVKNPELFRSVVETALTTEDVVAIGYRRAQLSVFEQLLEDEEFFAAKRDEWNASGPEDVWQRFFENNTWIFGYGLQYVFLSKWDERPSGKLKQMVSGSSMNHHGKEVDALTKTSGAISSACFVEIKRHTEELVQRKEYRSGCWPVSEELVSAVTQVQQTMRHALNDLSTDEELGIPESADVVYLYQPKAFVLIGNLATFRRADGLVDKDKWSSFQLFRRSMTNPEIITFDELLERARHIVKHSLDLSDMSVSSIDVSSFNGEEDSRDDEVPF